MGKNVVIIGSTGSIGISTLDVISNNPGEYNVMGLVCRGSVKILINQIKKFNPEFVSVYSAEAKDELEYELKKSKSSVKIYSGEKGTIEAACYKKSDIVVMAVVGVAGVLPTLAAIEKRKKICLANKESLVCAGDIIMREAARKKVKILPVDSEHSAIFQLLENVKKSQLRRIILTASGGPFRGLLKADLEKIIPADALKHPNWNMGSKITVDSATLMNKGLEVIEAMKLFNLPPCDIDVVIHPQSIIHSMIELKDGTLFAQLGYPDMRIPINFALAYPRRFDTNYIKKFDFFKAGSFTFEKPDMLSFPCLKLAYTAAKKGGIMPVVLNASNEVAVYEFLEGKICFNDIPLLIKKVMNKYTNNSNMPPSLESIMELDRRVRVETKTVLMSRPWKNYRNIICNKTESE